MRLLVALAVLVVAGVALVGVVVGEPPLPYELRCHDLDVATCRERAEVLAARIGGTEITIESIDIGRIGYGACWRLSEGGGCVEGMYPDAD